MEDRESLAALHRAVDLGVNFIDTADIYGMGRSERLVAQLRKERSETIYVATKMGRKLSPHTAAGYNAANFAVFVEESLRNLATDCLDLVQLHCPPVEALLHARGVRRAGRAGAAGQDPPLRRERREGRGGAEGDRVSPTCRRSRSSSTPSGTGRPELFFREAKKRQVGILARVPLASGLLTGKMTPATQFAANDHRNFNRYGAERSTWARLSSGVASRGGLQGGGGTAAARSARA